MYSSTLSLTSALDGASGQRHAPAALSPGKSRCPLYRRLAGPQGRSGRLKSHNVRKNSPESRTCVCIYRKEGAGLTGTQLFTTTAFILLLFIKVAMFSKLIKYVYHNARFKKRKVYYIMFVKLYNWKYLVAGPQIPSSRAACWSVLVQAMKRKLRCCHPQATRRIFNHLNR
jgi:hypothetical protein